MQRRAGTKRQPLAKRRRPGNGEDTRVDRNCIWYGRTNLERAAACLGQRSAGFKRHDGEVQRLSGRYANCSRCVVRHHYRMETVEGHVVRRVHGAARKHEVGIVGGVRHRKVAAQRQRAAILVYDKQAWRHAGLAAHRESVRHFKNAGIADERRRIRRIGQVFKPEHLWPEDQPSVLGHGRLEHVHVDRPSEIAFPAGFHNVSVGRATAAGLREAVFTEHESSARFGSDIRAEVGEA